MFPEIVHVTSKQSRTLLTWTHYRELLRVEDPKVRAWYEREAADQSWNVGGAFAKHLQPVLRAHALEPR